MGDVNRSWTDSVTNAALFARLDTVEYLDWLGSRTSSVNSALPQFLHEFTHHWCFDSLVGSATAMTRMRAQRYALLSPRSHSSQILGDLVRAETAERILQPLAEGLALFAEFDIKPASGGVYSETTVASIVCFGIPIGPVRASTIQNFDIALGALLQSTRRRRDFLERKAGVLAMPYEYDHGYLSGYLSVKALWATLAPRAKSLQDKDTFLAFLRAWIYEDAGLALAITTEHTNELRSAEGIVQRLYDRFSRLDNHPDLPGLVERWEQAVDQKQPTTAALELTDDLAFRAEQAILLLLQDSGDEGPIGDFAAHAYTTLLERKFVTLGSLAATAVAHPDGVVDLLAGGSTTRYEAVDAMPPGKTEGEIHVVLPSRIRCVVICFVSPQGVHRLKTVGKTAGLDDDELDRYLLNRQTNERLNADLQAALEAATVDAVASVVLPHVRAQVAKCCDQIYARLATLLVEEDAIGPVLALLRKKGLLSIVDGDHDLLRGLAAIGLANTMGSDSASMMLQTKFLGLDDALVERTIREATMRHGMHLLQPGERYGGATALV